MDFFETWNKLNALNEKWITGEDPSFERLWVSESAVEFKNFIRSSAERKNPAGYRLIVQDGLYAAANPYDINHDQMAGLL